MQLQRVQPAFDGQNTNSAPDYLGAAEGALVENLLVDRPGKLTMRGPIRRLISLADGSGYLPSYQAAWTFDDKVLVPYGNAGTWKHKIMTLPSGTAADVASSNYYLAAPHDRIGDYVFGLYDNGASPRILRWDGAAGYVEHIFGPQEAIADVKAHQKRLFVLGGTSPGTVVAGQTVNNALYYSDVGGPVVDALASWQDDVSGLTNQLVVDCSPNELPIGLARAGRNLLMFFSSSVHVLTGDTSSAWTLRAVTREFGCHSRSSIVEFEDGVVFASTSRGVVWTDGVDVRVLSTPVQTDVLAELTTYTKMNATPLANGYVMFVAEGADEGWLCHVPTGRWARLSSAHALTAFSLTRLLGQTALSGYPFCLSSGSTPLLWLLDEIVVPERAAADVRGIDHGTAAIEAKWHSRLIPLSSPALRTSLHRLLLDYSFVQYGAVAEGDGWYVSVLDGQGNTVLAERQVASQLDPPAELGRKRYQTDMFGEATDIQLRVEWHAPDVGSAPFIATAEIYDATIEFQPGRQRPTG